MTPAAFTPAQWALLTQLVWLALGLAVVLALLVELLTILVAALRADPEIDILELTDVVELPAVSYGPEDQASREAVGVSSQTRPPAWVRSRWRSF